MVTRLKLLLIKIDILRDVNLAKCNILGLTMELTG